MEQNWRAGLAQGSRDRITNRIMETLQRHPPLSRQDDVTELWKIANRFEEKIFYAASDQHDYLRKISLKMLNLETLNLEMRKQNSLNGALPTSSDGPNSVRPLDSGITQVQSRQQVVHSAEGELLVNGVQGSAGSGKASSFAIINNVPQSVQLTIQHKMAQMQQARQQQQAQHDVSAAVAPQQHQFLLLQQQSPQQQQPHLLLQQHLQLQSFIRQQQSLKEQQPQSLFQQQPGLQQLPQAQVAPGDQFQQVGQPGGIDQADIVWSKMQALREKYLQDMKDLYNMLTKWSQQRMPEEQLQKLTHYKSVLQRMIPYLIAPKESLPKEFNQDKVEAFEKQIVSVLETFKRWKQVAPQLQQLGSISQVQAAQQPQQASQILQPDSEPVQQQQTPQMSSSLPAASPFLQFNPSSLQPEVCVATQATPCASLANASAKSLHQGNTAAFGQNNVSPLLMSVHGIQQQKEDQPLWLKAPEQSKQLYHILNLPDCTQTYFPLATAEERQIGSEPVMKRPVGAVCFLILVSGIFLLASLLMAITGCT